MQNKIKKLNKYIKSVNKYLQILHMEYQNYQKPNN